MVLSQRVTLIVPSNVQGAVLTRIERYALNSWVLSEFASWFGGATATLGQGSYKAESGELIHEAVTLVESWFSPDNFDSVKLVFDLARSIKELYQQESVAVQINDNLHLV